jgi:hypothetical protein
MTDRPHQEDCSQCAADQARVRRNDHVQGCEHTGGNELKSEARPKRAGHRTQTCQPQQRADEAYQEDWFHEHLGSIDMSTLHVDAPRGIATTSH